MVLRPRFHEQQALLGNWVSGFKKGNAKELKEELDQQKFDIKNESNLVYVNRAKWRYEDENGLAWSDEVRNAVPIMNSLTGEWIITCPECRSDVEPDHGSKEKTIFCRCDQCGVGYFIHELIINRNFRRLKFNENLECYDYVILKKESVKISIQGVFFEEMSVI